MPAKPETSEPQRPPHDVPSLHTVPRQVLVPDASGRGTRRVTGKQVSTVSTGHGRHGPLEISTSVNAQTMILGR